MRYLILLASLALAASALAEEKPKNVARELDKSSPQLMSANTPSDSTEASDAKEKHNKTKGRAQDYNSSRSNNSSAAAPHEGDVVHRDIAARKAEASDFGMSRATEASEGKVRAQDYNSSRSNTTAVREDSQGDLDRDGRVDLVTCRDGVDQDCDDDDVDASPANHNTTRSNRLAPATDGDDRVVRKKPGKR